MMHGRNIRENLPSNGLRHGLTLAAMVAATLAAMLSACATSDGVVPMADGTYTVTAEANFGPNKAVEAHKLALAEAERTCSAQGRELAVTTLDNSGDIGRAAGPLALRGETRLVFRCVARRP
ncbi:MAG TPA: hypothetical protein VFF72_06395 [Caldimonas sp.]|nr:hypothetical protein [Caldimonas sp.]